MCIIPPVGLSSFGRSGRDVDGDVVIDDSVLVHGQQINLGEDLVIGCLTAIALAAQLRKIMSFVYIPAHVEE